jgi:hypothetical protein
MIPIRVFLNKLMRTHLSFSSSVMERSAGFSTEGRWKGEGRRVRRDTLAELAGPDQQVCLYSVVDPDPGSGAFLTPWIRNRFYPDPGSQISDPIPIFLRALVTIFGGKKYYNFSSIG